MTVAFTLFSVFIGSIITSMSFTYGSFGDIITTVQVVCRFAQALSESRGSAREFQDLIVELRLYQNTLQQVTFSC